MHISLQFCLNITNAVAKTHNSKKRLAVTCRSTTCQKKCMKSGIFTLVCLVKAILLNKWTDQPILSIISGSFQSDFLSKPIREPLVIDLGENQGMSKTCFLVYPFLHQKLEQGYHLYNNEYVAQYLS